MTPEEKEWIDSASLYSLLRVWRFTEAGDPLFQGETGDYFRKRMFGLRDTDHAAWVRASKDLG